MTINLFQTEEYKTLITDYISNTIGYLFHKNQEFALACEVEHITFIPTIPNEIQETFEETVMFLLSGYTYESAKLEDGYFFFEAGFGPDNFGATVSIPLLAIKQVFVGDYPIVLNLAKYTPKTSKIDKNSTKNSMEALLKNPENKKLLKKKNS